MICFPYFVGTYSTEVVPNCHISTKKIQDIPGHGQGRAEGGSARE